MLDFGYFCELYMLLYQWNYVYSLFKHRKVKLWRENINILERRDNVILMLIRRDQGSKFQKQSAPRRIYSNLH